MPLSTITAIIVISLGYLAKGWLIVLSKTVKFMIIEIQSKIKKELNFKNLPTITSSKCRAANDFFVFPLPVKLYPSAQLLLTSLLRFILVISMVPFPPIVVQNAT